MIVKPLYGHTDAESAYVVEDYPYSFKLRCKIRYWIESDKKKGIRFVSQTSNPKKGDIWNAPKKSTYQLFAGCMYLDENNHVHWAGLSEYSDAQKFLDFFKSFPKIKLPVEQARLIFAAVASKRVICKGLSMGKAMFSVNGVPQFPSELEMEEAKKELEMWCEVQNLMGEPVI